MPPKSRACSEPRLLYFEIDVKRWALFVILMISFLRVGSGQEIEIFILPIVDPKRAVLIEFDGSKLVSQTGEKEQISHALSPSMRQTIQKAIQSSPQEGWSGYWASTAVLDGYEIVAKAKHGGKMLKFSGSNGCPPGFSKIIATIHQATELKILRSGWSDIEKASKRYKSRESFFDSVVKMAKTAQKESQDGQSETPRKLRSKVQQKPDRESKENLK